MYGKGRAVNHHGFMLGEALIALSVLTIGLLVALESMGMAHRTGERSARRSLIAACAQEHLISLVAQRSAASEACTALIWKEQRVPASSHAVRRTLRVSLNDGNPQEDVFETITLAE